MPSTPRCRRFALTALLLATRLLAPAPAAAGQATLVPFGAEWRYLDDGVDPGATWTSVAFDDSAWASGTARLGYGDENVVTTVDYGPSSSSKHPTTWMRTTFTVDEPGDFSTLYLRLVRDDGALVWLNGVEIARSNLPAGPVLASTLASSSVSGRDEVRRQRFELPSAALVTGANVLAVEVHQSSASSSDLGFDLELVATDAPTEITRGPYLQRVGHDSAVLRWRTADATDSRVRLGAAPGSLSTTVDDGAITTEHEVFLGGLAAGTTYFYSVGSTTHEMAGDDADHFLRTSPAPGSPVDTRIWVLGDSGTADASAEAVRNAWRGMAATRAADLVLMLGDNAYETGTDEEYQEAVFDMYAKELATAPLWPAFGNHDGYSADSGSESGVYYDIFTLPRMGEAGGTASGTEAWYSFDHGDVHFVCLDSHDSDRDPSGAMLDWLEQDLAASTSRWLVAYWHHPPYSEGSHRSDSEGTLVEMRENALPILEAAGVDLVLAGHSHSYERSYLLDGHYGLSSSFAPWMIVDGGDGDPLGDGAYVKSTDRLPHEGAVYAVAGSSGKTSGGPLDHPAMLVSLDALGSLVVDIAGDTMDVTFVDASGIAADGFRIEKTRTAACGDGVLDPAEDCDDGNAADGDCCPADCSFDGGCVEAGRASLRVVHDAASPGRDSLQWKWGRGGAFDTADLGDPAATTSYALCVYDRDGGDMASLARLDLAPGTAWRSAGAGFAYKDSAGASDGVRKAKLKPGAAGKTKVQVAASGAAMDLPAAFEPAALYAQDPEVLVQLVSSAGRCWSSAFASANGTRIDATTFLDQEP